MRRRFSDSASQRVNDSTSQRVNESTIRRVSESANQRSAESLNRRFVLAESLIRRIAPWLGVSIFLGLFFFYPLTRILALSLDFSALTADNFTLTFYVLRFTFFQAFLSTLLTLLIGLPAAYLFARFDLDRKSTRLNSSHT